MLSHLEKVQLQQRLQTLIADCDEIQAALVVTVDGHLCAMQQRENYPLERLATMGSSLMSLGDTITAELRLGSCKNIIAENEEGIVAFMHVNSALVLVTLTVQKNAMGLLIAHSRRCATELSKTLGT